PGEYRMCITRWFVQQKQFITSRSSLEYENNSDVEQMKKPERMFIAMVLGLALLVVPIVSASALSFGNSMISSDTTYSGDGVLNQTTDIKWSTGTTGQTETYQWNQSSVNRNLFSQKTQSLLNVRQENGSMHWAFQKTGYSVPFQSPINLYVDDHTITMPQFHLSHAAVGFFPGNGFIYS
ncbi:MAG: hypothetical protein WCK53_12200, partial [Methanomicrobiales archaeon]